MSCAMSIASSIACATIARSSSHSRLSLARPQREKDRQAETEKGERKGERETFFFFVCRLLLLVPLSSFSCLKATGFFTPGMHYTRTSSCATENTFLSSLCSLTGLALALICVNITRAKTCIRMRCFIFLSFVFFLCLFCFCSFPDAAPFPPSRPLALVLTHLL